MTDMGDRAVPGAGPGGDEVTDAAAPAPAMPLIQPSEQYVGSPYPLVDGARLTLGWLWRGDRAFALVTRGLSGGYKARDTSPLTADGWGPGGRGPRPGQLPHHVGQPPVRRDRGPGGPGQPPEDLRIYLSRPLGEIRAAHAAAAAPDGGGAARVGHLTRLASMLDSGLLTRAEFDILKAGPLRRP
jgi:hypothetical protein